LADKVFKRLGLALSFVDMSDPGKVEAALTPKTKLVWCETPTNPMLKIADLAALAEICRKRGAISVCDNTFATPFFQKPLDLGIDLRSEERRVGKECRPWLCTYHSNKSTR